MKSFPGSKPVLALLLPILLAGCAHQSGSPATLAIDSSPSGAEVQVMGKAYGTTPTRLPLATIFPVSYPVEQQGEYGKVHFTHPECAPLTMTVSNVALESGLYGKLACQNTRPAVVPATSQESPAPRPQIDNTTRGRLLQLDELKQNGLISDTEYQTIRQRILDSL